MGTTGISRSDGGSANGHKRPRATSNGSTGPRTETGKDRIKYNALKHGLYAKAVLLQHESESQFKDLLVGLQQDFLPKGKLERLLVEKLAANFWRHRRLLQVESADLQDKVNHRLDEVHGVSRGSLRLHWQLQKETAESNRVGVLPDSYEHPESLEYCIEKLDDACMYAEKYGLEYEACRIHLGLVYGARYPGRPGKDLFDYYLQCLGALKAPAGERERLGFASEADCVQKFIARTTTEIHHLESRRSKRPPEPEQEPLMDEDRAKKVGLLKCTIFKSTEQDQLLRSEAHLDRQFERILIQLEHLQKTRRGTIDLTSQTRV